MGWQVTLPSHGSLSEGDAPTQLHGAASHRNTSDGRTTGNDITGSIHFQRGAGQSEARMIEDVGRVRSNLEMNLFPDRKRFAHREVHFREPRTVQAISSRIAKSSRVGRRERSFVEPLIRSVICPVTGKMRIPYDIWEPASCLRIGVIRAHSYRERLTALHDDSAGTLPAAEYFI